MFKKIALYIEDSCLESSEIVRQAARQATQQLLQNKRLEKISGIVHKIDLLFQDLGLNSSSSSSATSSPTLPSGSQKKLKKGSKSPQATSPRQRELKSCLEACRKILTQLSSVEVVANPKQYIDLIKALTDIQKDLAQLKDIEWIHPIQTGILTLFEELSVEKMVYSPQWLKWIPEAMRSNQEISSRGMQILENISKQNIDKMFLELQELTAVEARFLTQVQRELPIVVSHGTNYVYSVEKDQKIVSGSLLNKDVKISTSQRNVDALQNEQHVFCRISAGKGVTAHRYGGSTLVIPEIREFPTFFERGWFSLYDPLMPFHSATFRQIIWPAAFGTIPEAVTAGQDSPLRQTQWDEKSFHWTHCYPGGLEINETFQETIFIGRDFFEAAGFKMILELRRMCRDQSEDSLAYAYRAAFFDSAPSTMAQIILHDFMRIEAKIPAYLPISPRATYAINADGAFLNWPNGDDFIIGRQLNPIIQEFGAASHLPESPTKEESLKKLGGILQKHNLNVEVKIRQNYGDQIARHPEFILRYVTCLKSAINLGGQKLKHEGIKNFFESLTKIATNASRLSPIDPQSDLVSPLMPKVSSSAELGPILKSLQTHRADTIQKSMERRLGNPGGISSLKTESSISQSQEQISIRSMFQQVYLSQNGIQELRVFQ